MTLSAAIRWPSVTREDRDQVYEDRDTESGWDATPNLHVSASLKSRVKEGE